MTIVLKDVTSSNIAAVGHEGETLHIRFKGGAVWSYHPVTDATFKEMMAAESIGSYFARNVKPHTQAARIGG